ncbi:MAG: HD domain-containing protein [Syntrophaceae bacterium]|nr:HD domain-containing protein [Syntrophaceae bacterium]
MSKHDLKEISPEDRWAQTVEASMFDRSEGLDSPSASECRELLRKRYRVDTGLIRHSEKVAQLAVTIGKALNKKGLELDLRLIEAASLLHDMFRGERDHGLLAGRLLRQLEYPKVAYIVENHMQPFYQDRDKLTEHVIVCLSDKFVQEDCLVPLEVRFEKKLVYYANNPRIKTMVHSRFMDAKTAQTHVEIILGHPIEKFFAQLSK